MLVEQLRYTWAKKGIEGLGRLQPVAASDGLYAGNHPERRLALRLCRYDLPSQMRDVQTAPVSYGWIDSGLQRFAFRRTYMGDDSFGRPGVFAAHILVGPIQALPSAQLLALFDSPSWWTGEECPVGLASRVRLSDMELGPGMPAEAETSRRFLALLLARRGHLSVAVDAEELASAAYLISLRVPDLFEQLSFSTHESGQSATWFDVVGEGGSDRPSSMRLSDVDASPSWAQASAAGSFVFASGDTAVKQTASAWRFSSTGGRADLRTFSAALAGLHGIGLGEKCTLDLVIPAMRIPELIAGVLDDHTTRQLTAAALLNGDARVHSILHNNGAHLDPDVWQSLGSLIADLLDKRDGGAAAWASSHQCSSQTDQWWQLSPLLVGSLGHSLATQNPSSTQFHLWPQPLVQGALRSGAANLSDARPAVIAAAAHCSAALVSDQDIDAEVRAEVIEARQVAGLPLQGLFEWDPALSLATAHRLNVRNLKALVDSLPANEAWEFLAHAYVRGIDESSCLDLVKSVADRVGPELAPTFLADLDRRCVGGLRRAAGLVEWAIHAHLSAVLKTPGSPWDMAALSRLCHRQQSPLCQSWSGLMASVQQARRGTLRGRIGITCVQDCFASAGRMPEDVRGIAAGFCFDVLANESRTRDLWMEAAVGLAQVSAADDASILSATLMASARAAKADSDMEIAAAGLKFACIDLLAVQQESMRFGRFKRRGASQGASVTDGRRAALILQRVAQFRPDIYEDLFSQCEDAGSLARSLIRAKHA